jgi:hypothetical protein
MSGRRPLSSGSPPANYVSAPSQERHKLSPAPDPLRARGGGGPRPLRYIALPAGFAARCSILFLNGGHYSELEETLGAGLPAILATIALSLLLFLLAALPPSALPAGISELLAHRRRQIAAVGASIFVGAAAGLLIVFWTL